MEERVSEIVNTGRYRGRWGGGEERKSKIDR